MNKNDPIGINEMKSLVIFISNILTNIFIILKHKYAFLNLLIAYYKINQCI